MSGKHEQSHQRKLLRLPEVLQRVPVSKSTWIAGVKSGKFPQPVKLGPRTHCWRIEEIEDLISEGVRNG